LRDGESVSGRRARDISSGRGLVPGGFPRPEQPPIRHGVGAGCVQTACEVVFRAFPV